MTENLIKDLRHQKSGLYYDCKNSHELKWSEKLCEKKHNELEELTLKINELEKNSYIGI